MVCILTSHTFFAIDNIYVYTMKTKQLDIDNIINTFPKGYEKRINKIISYYYKKGYEQSTIDIKELLEQIPLNKNIQEYGIFHEDNLDGG